VAERKAFLLRIDPEVFGALQRWAADDLRSLNGHIEFVLRRALQEAGRLRPNGGNGPGGGEGGAVPPAANVGPEGGVRE
jgi:hypothetical protein